MRLKCQAIPNWPKLAWVAVNVRGTQQVDIYHGPCLELAEQWCVEAVWDGDFSAGDFDQSENIFGSGVRIRGDKAVFVSSTATYDRLVHFEDDDLIYVSNSLPCLLAISNLSLNSDYPSYSSDILSATLGPEKAVKWLPADRGEIGITYFRNIELAAGQLTWVEKPDRAVAWSSFGDYSRFLEETARRLAQNSMESGRAHAIGMLTTVSSGYDSSAAAAIASKAGCKNAATFTKARSTFGRSDSGEAIAEILGLNCATYVRADAQKSEELSIWAAAGVIHDLNFTAFKYEQPLTLVFTGFHGDCIWDRSGTIDSDPLYRGGSGTGQGLSEYRLIEGFFHCPPTFFGIRQSALVHAISASSEMADYTLNNDYDRPICRRILEEAGVPRGHFGKRKEATALHEHTFNWPLSPKGRQSFAQYLKSRGISVPFSLLYKTMHRFDHHFLDVMRRRYSAHWLPVVRPLTTANDLLFQWANTELAAERLETLMEAGVVIDSGLTQTAAE